MNKNISKLATPALIVLTLGLSGLLLTGCSVVDALKKQMPAQTTTNSDITPTDDLVPNLDDGTGQTEPQPTDFLQEDNTDPADSIDQAIKNLDTLPTESPLSEQ